MKRFLPVLIFCFALICPAIAQTGADAPATKEDIEKYMEATHVRQLFDQMMTSMAEPMHQMTREQCAQNRDKLPADCEATMNRIMDAMLKEMPFGEMLEAMVPVYQKYLSKGDVEQLIAFYNSPVGQKITRVSPQMMSEAMNAIMPIVQRYTQQMQERMQKEIMDGMKDSPASKQPGAAPAKAQ